MFAGLVIRHSEFDLINAFETGHEKAQREALLGANGFPVHGVANDAIVHGLGEAVGVVPMTGGSAPVFRIDCADGEALILKTYPDDRPWNPQKDAYAAGLVRDLGVPVTQYHAIDQTKTPVAIGDAATFSFDGAHISLFEEDGGARL